LIVFVCAAIFIVQENLIVNIGRRCAHLLARSQLAIGAISGDAPNRRNRERMPFNHPKSTNKRREGGRGCCYIVLGCKAKPFLLVSFVACFVGGSPLLECCREQFSQDFRQRQKALSMIQKKSGILYTKES